jgi:hypothetical protein
MVELTPDTFRRLIAFISSAFGLVAIILVCVGIGTPNWESSYTNAGGQTYSLIGSANFFYTCVFNNGTFNNCTNRAVNLTGYPRYSSSLAWMTDYNIRMQNAAGLCIVGILFLAFGTVATLLMGLIPLSTWINLLPPALLFLACLFMLAGMAEGARYLLYNDYSANLYQAGHLFTMLAAFLSSLAAGSIHHSRWTEQIGKPIPK